MWGYRIVRIAELVSLMHQIADLQLEVRTLLRQLGDARATAASKTTLADMLTTRVNVLEAEHAQIRHKVTGLPQIAPQIGIGTPRMTELLDENLFDDPGDVKADALRAAGMLPTDLASVADGPPSAADLMREF